MPFFPQYLYYLNKNDFQNGSTKNFENEIFIVFVSVVHKLLVPIVIKNSYFDAFLFEFNYLKL
jgi:hypothetical protein